jgi:hypothetical protein
MQFMQTLRGDHSSCPRHQLIMLNEPAVILINLHVQIQMRLWHDTPIPFVISVLLFRSGVLKSLHKRPIINEMSS